MKKLLTVLSCFILGVSLCACNKEPEPSTDEQPQIQVARFDCHEYNIEGQYFTDDILVSINLTSDFEATDQSVLLAQDNKYYIGEFKRKDAEGNVNKTVSLFEYNDSEFNFATDCSKVSQNWSISNSSIENDDAYMRIFYTEKNGYIIGMSIVNTSKDPLSIEDALQNVEFMVNETCTAPDPIEEQSAVVEGSLSSPARLGEWVSTMLYNPEVGTYEPVCISVTKVETGELADRVVTDHNNLLDLYAGDQPSQILNPTDCIWAVYRYEVYFPTSFTAEKNITGITVPITFCNINDDDGGISGYLELQQSLLDISPSMKNVKPGTIWSEGVGFFEIPINANYLIKITPDDNPANAKYFKP